ALTGWSVVDGQFREVAIRHDPGEKVILGRKGKWRTPDVVKMLVEHPATARRLAWRLGETFFGEGALDAGALNALAEGLAKRELDTGWAVQTILRSKVFFAEANLRRKVLDPVGFVVGGARALELFDPPSSTLVLAEWAGRLGQDLFYPPNVGGWPGGR